MAEAANGDQDDGDIGIAGDGDEGQGEHQERAGYRAGDHRVHSRTAEPANIQAGEVAADHAAEIGGEKRQPGEHGDLLQIHAVLFRQVQRHPETQHRPGGLGHKGGNGDPVETFIFRDGFERGKEGLFYRRGFVILFDVLQLAFAEIGVLFRV